MKLGIGTYAFMWSIGFKGAQPAKPMTAAGFIEKARELGVGLAQFGPNLSLDELGDAELDEVIALARERNVEIEAGTRGIEPAHVRRWIGIAKRCGASLIRSLPEFADGRIPSYDELVFNLRCAAPELADARVKLALENHGHTRAVDLSRALNDVGSPWIGVTLDTLNSLAIPEGTDHVARTLARHTMCLHVKDFAIFRVWHMMGFSVEGRPAGKGQLNVPWVLDTLKQAGADFNVILELWPPEQKTLEETIALEHAWAAESIPYLRALIP